MKKYGFYTALGTPLTDEGKVIKSALKAHIEQQITAGASGLLLMGSMGIESCIRHSEYGAAVDTAIEAVKGKRPLFVGAMDNSIARVKERLEIIGEGRRIDGIVVTMPYYSAVCEADAIYWLNSVASISPYPVYVYDLPAVTRFKINMRVIDAVIDNPNIKGMKSPDWELILAIKRKYPEREFESLYSGLDSFDHAARLGIGKQLDGMFACTPRNAVEMYKCLNSGDFIGARRHLDNILLLRDTMIANGLMRCFTVCMNLIGIEGCFYQDYTAPIDVGRAISIMRATLERIGELE